MRTTATLLAIALLPSLAFAQYSYTAGDVLVAPQPAHRTAVREQLQQLGLTIAETDAISGTLRIQVPPGTEDHWVIRLTRTAGIAFAERNGLGGGGQVPNDTLFANQWHHRNTGQSGGTPGADLNTTAAWDVTTGSTDIVVAVLDTGIDTDHPEFAGRIDPNGYDFVNEDPNPEADHPHGSQVAGMLCANANNGFAVTGVDWQCKVMPIKVLNANNAGTTFDLAQGLNYCATQPSVRVVSMSLINYPGNQTLLGALQTASAAGKILVACAGNGGIGNADVSFPGASPLAISIGASTATDSRAGFSATGAALDFVAPGASVVTVQHNTSANASSTVSGCSFATPSTAGVIALLLARARELDLPWPAQTTVYDLLRSGARDQVGPSGEDIPGRDNFFGHGRIDARASLDAVPQLIDCTYGTVGNGFGGPFDVVRCNGASIQNGRRRIVVPAGLPAVIGVDAPPSNPASSPVPSSVILVAHLDAANPAAPWALPLGLGELCFDATDSSVMAVFADVAPWSTVTPPLPAGLVFALQGVIVDTPLGTLARTNVVNVDAQPAPPPSISQIGPSLPLPGATVTITGNGFLPGLQLQVGGAPILPSSVAATTITFAAPPNLPCDANVVVTNPDLQSASTLLQPSPVLTGTQNIGGTPAAGGTILILNGQFFAVGTTVTVGGTPMPLVFASTTSLSGTLPPGTPGPAAIVITTPAGCVATGSITYTP
jgi:subtilisin family serine protease